ncbi:cytochrome P450 714A1-like [Silene latifolia]|uniref:cytochrome P450 714A1-like n=1 Tax=Silene latifolia TaxID=37657 RepID=UPI003D77D0DF
MEEASNENLYIMIILSLLICGVVKFVIELYKNNLWVKCEMQRRKLRKQGIKGPSPSFLYGNVSKMDKIRAMVAKETPLNSSNNNGEIVGHDYTSSLFPYFEQWRKEFGRVYTYSTGNRQHLYVNDPELVREMSQSMTLVLGKPSYITKTLAPMLGNGILRSNGTVWAQQRKIIAAQFFMDKVKAMMELMKEAAQPLLGKWESCIEAQEGPIAEVRVDEDLRTVSADVISRACFGSSYYKGKMIFLKLRTLQKLISNQNFLFKLPTIGFLNTKSQKEVKSLEKEIESLIWEAVEERVEECSKKSAPEKDLMQWILDDAINSQDLDKESSKQLIVDNCKNIYFAGHESTAVAASWCLMLLALHPEWQHRIRDEVTQLCQHNNDFVPDADSLLKMKSVTMVIQETLRLYPPAAFISREALEEFQIGSIGVPKGVCLWTLIPTLHRDPDIWGPDSNEFKPQRFANGVTNACKVPQAYVPFGLGARLCLGKNFAMVQLKLLLCLIISRFSFSLSPNYRHAPAYRMIVEPQHGVQILIKRI